MDLNNLTPYVRLRINVLGLISFLFFFSLFSFLKCPKKYHCPQQAIESYLQLPLTVLKLWILHLMSSNPPFTHKVNDKNHSF